MGKEPFGYLGTAAGRRDLFVRHFHFFLMNGDAEYGGDISFVGSLYSEKSRYDRLLADNLLSSYTQGYVNGLILFRLILDA